MDIGLAGAFAGGVLTLLSPCSVMLLPAFFSYAFTHPRLLLARTGLFYLGLITTLVPLGVLAGTLGAFVTVHRSIIVTIASILVIVLGVVMLLGSPIPMLRTRTTQAQDATSAAAVYALGTVYGLAGVCAGPLLGAVLTLAGMGGNAVYGGVVLLVFAAGMAAPLLVLSFVWGRLPFVRHLVRPREVRIGPLRTTWTTIVGGALTICIGVLLLVTGGTASLGSVFGATDQLALESTVARLTAGIPDVVILIAVLLVAATVWTIVLLSRRRRERVRDAGQPEVQAPRGKSSDARG